MTDNEDNFIDEEIESKVEKLISNIEARSTQVILCRTGFLRLPLEGKLSDGV